MRPPLVSLPARIAVLTFVFSFALPAFPSPASAEEHSVAPYVDPTQIDVPWPKHSDYRQPWRAFLETRDGSEFLRGVGINYNVPGQEDLAVRLLAEAGFKTFRIEIGWSSVKWDESGISNQEHFHNLLGLCKRYGIRPTLLLNANQARPCPTLFFEKTLAADAPQGSRTIRLADTNGLVPAYSGLNNLSPNSYWACEAFVTAVNKETGECQLSKPLPVALDKSKPLKMATLKYLPLYRPGTPQFEETAAGWVKYANLIAKLAADAGIEEFDLELWNELSFGSNFTGINHYYDPPADPVPSRLAASAAAPPGKPPGGPSSRSARTTPGPLHLGLFQHDLLPLTRSPSCRRGPTARATTPTAPAHVDSPHRRTTPTTRTSTWTGSCRPWRSACPRGGRTSSTRPSA